MSQPYLGEMRAFGFNFAPKFYAFANGQTMSIAQNQALFALFGTTYGGDGISTFALPNLQGSVPLHRGPGFTQGQRAGETTVTLNITQIPAHTHPFLVSNGNATSTDPAKNAPAATAGAIYGDPGTTPFDSSATTPVGGSQAHDNMQPYLVINWCVAIQGAFPSRN